MYTLLGYYHYNNCGDQALLAAALKILDGIEVAVASPKNKSKMTDKIILGGGDIINPFFLDLVKDARDVKVLGAGLGYESELDLLCRLDNVSQVFFRNRKDVELARARGLDAYYTPDIVFKLDVPNVIKKPGKKKVLGIMLADSISASHKQKDFQQIHYGQFLKVTLASVLAELREYYRVVFIPMCHARYQYDVKMMYEVLSFLPPVEVEHEVLSYAEPEQVLEAVSQLDVLMTMRFHGLIFATLAGVPVINIGVTRKTETYMLEHGLEGLSVKPFTLSRERLLETVKYAEQAGTAEKILEVREEKRRQVDEVAAHFRALMASPQG